VPQEGLPSISRGYAAPVALPAPDHVYVILTLSRDWDEKIFAVCNNFLIKCFFRYEIKRRGSVVTPSTFFLPL